VHFPLQVKPDVRENQVRDFLLRDSNRKQGCKLSARNYRFEILQRIQIKKRRLIGENCFEVQIWQNHFIPEGS